MAESSRFRKTVDLIKQRANSILEVVRETVGLIAGVLLAFIFPSVFQWVYNDLPDAVADFIFGISAIFYVFLDPLFMYVPLINKDTKCVKLDNRLKIAAIVLRSFGDLRYVMRIYLRIKRGLQNNDKEMPSRVDVDGRQESNSLKMDKMIGIKDDRQNSNFLKKIAMSANDVVCILPVPQVVILIFLPKMRGSRSLKIMKFFNSLILLQYVPRLYPIFKIYMQVNKDILNLLKKKSKDMSDDKKLPIKVPKWFGIAINIVGYILASHVLGAFWYFFSIQREIDCWGYACRIENGCEFSTSCVESTFRNVTHINNLCPINPSNATVFDFGIFLYALQSGMQGSTNFPEKLLQCFSWGLRNLSSFASNLNSSTYGWENLFVVVISISGLVLFMYLLGHSQTYMQETDRRQSVKRKMKVIIEQKLPSLLFDYGLPSGTFFENTFLEEDIKDVIEQILEKDEDFIVENMFSILSFNLPEYQFIKNDIDLEIKRWLFLGKLEKVEGLKDKNNRVLLRICKHLEPMIYTEGSYIIREGEPLDMMFFVTWGNVLTYATNNGGSSCSSGTIQIIEKEKDSFYGEELLTLAEWTSSKLSTLPISTFSVKSQKKVEIFALKATDLPNVVSKNPGHSNMDLKEIKVHNNSSNLSLRHASRKIHEGRARLGDVSKRDTGYESC